MDSRSGRLDSAILPSGNLLGNSSPRLASDIPPSARLLGSRSIPPSARLLGSRSPRLAGSALLLGAQRAGPRACRRKTQNEASLFII